MDEYKRYLAEQILTEDKLITYRYLSRALKVHVNTAKQMLFEFHKSQNAKKPGAIHATYLVYGTKKPGSHEGVSQEDGDVEMTSSMPDVDSVHEEVPVVTMSLVPEESLGDVLSHYEEVSSIHVYSVGPHPIKDLQLLSDTARQVLDLSLSDTESESIKTYGTISNPYLRQRERKGTIPTPSVAAKKGEPKSQPTKPGGATATEEPKPPKTAALKESTASSTTAKKPVPSLQRGGSSGIMQAFAKGASAKPKQKTTKQAPPEDHSTQTLSDDGEDDTDVLPQPKASKTGDHKSRKEREEELRLMMEEDDEVQEEKEDTPMEEPEEQEEPEEPEEPADEVPAPEPAKEEPAEVVSTSTGDGRRRGKRRVMRKKQIMDDQGYLVTIQEPGWESFSEDEPAPTKIKSSHTSAPPSQAAKAKKSGPKGSQGSIMSFFGKK